MAKTSEKKLDKLIDEIYRRRCSGIEINIMDIGKIFNAGRTAFRAGLDMEAAIVAKVEELRKN